MMTAIVSLCIGSRTHVLHGVHQEFFHMSQDYLEALSCRMDLIVPEQHWMEVKSINDQRLTANC